MADFIDGIIAGWCRRRAAILLWKRQKLLCMEANALHRIRCRLAGRVDEEAPF